MPDMDIAALARRLPKAELHLHIEGTLEPELMFALAKRNKLTLRFSSVEEVRRAYQFANLQSFLDIYYEGAAVLQTRQDFADLAWAYLKKAADDGVKRAEVFFDPQSHTSRGIPMADVVGGLTDALARAEQELGVSAALIMCFLRHLPEDDALRTLDQAGPLLDKILGVGLDSGEKGNPPVKFKKAFARARSAGLHVVAHAGEEGPADYIRQALDVLGAERIDHGVRCLEDGALVERLAREKVPLTVCPLSNVKLRVFDKLQDHNLKTLLARGLRACVNSDDPAYFGGYVLANLIETQRALELSPRELALLAKNSFAASFLPEAEKRRFSAEIDRCLSEPSSSPR